MPHVEFKETPKAFLNRMKTEFMQAENIVDLIKNSIRETRRELEKRKT